MRRRTIVSVIVLALVGGGVGQAQEPERTLQEERARQEQMQRDRDELIPLSVDVVVSRYRGEKAVSSLPFTLAVNARKLAGIPGELSNLRMGAELPVPVMTPTTVDGKPVPVAGGPVQYRNVGTSIDARATLTSDGRYHLNLAVEDTSMYVNDQVTLEAPPVGQVPVFRTFSSRNELVLRDGESRQFTLATDRISGEIIKVDVTLTVVK
jgi:hypothetical protein